MIDAGLAQKAPHIYLISTLAYIISSFLVFGLYHQTIEDWLDGKLQLGNKLVKSFSL
jgi:uncharacterized membrane protein YdjX (TVP38/TMEM64 family)